MRGTVSRDCCPSPCTLSPKTFSLRSCFVAGRGKLGPLFFPFPSATWVRIVCKILAEETAMAKTKVTSKGQVTIPKEIRDYLKLKPGDEVFFVIDNQRRRVTFWAKNGDIREMAGILKDVVPKRRRPVTVEEMNEAILREHSRERAKKR